MNFRRFINQVDFEQEIKNRAASFAKLNGIVANDSHRQAPVSWLHLGFIRAVADKYQQKLKVSSNYIMLKDSLLSDI